MRPFSLLVLLMAIALVLGEENSAKKQDENEDDGEGELPKQERGKSNALTYLILKRKAIMTYTNQNTAARKNIRYINAKKSNI